MGVKLVSFPLRKEHRLRCAGEQECWGKCLDPRRREWQDDTEYCIMRSISICSPYHILGRSNQGWDGWEKEHADKKLIKVKKCKFVPVQTMKPYTIFIHLVVCLMTGP